MVRALIAQRRQRKPKLRQIYRRCDSHNQHQIICIITRQNRHKKTGLKTPPCFTPFKTQKCLDKLPFHETRAVLFTIPKTFNKTVTKLNLKRFIITINIFKTKVPLRQSITDAITVLLPSLLCTNTAKCL